MYLASSCVTGGKKKIKNQLLFQSLLGRQVAPSQAHDFVA
jgi:hypothetical protein